MKRCAAFGRNDCVLFLLQFYVFYVFTSRAANLTPFGVMIFDFCVFTSRSTSPTTSGGSIFRCTTKDRGERRAKGVATPFNPLGLMRDRKPDVLWLYVFAMVQLTRLSRLRRCRLFPCLCVLRCPERSEHFRNHLTAKLAKRWLFFESQQFRRTWCSRQESGGSSACNRAARCKEEAPCFGAATRNNSFRHATGRA